MIERHALVAAVEIAHGAVAHVDGANRQAHAAGVDVLEVDQAGERGAQRLRRVIARGFHAERDVRTQPRGTVRLEERWDAAKDRGQVDRRVGESGEVLQKIGRCRARFDARPEFLQPRKPALPCVAGDQGGIDRTDRRPDHPIGFRAAFVHRLVDAHLVGAECAAALQDKDHLARERTPCGCVRRPAVSRCRVRCHEPVTRAVNPLNMIPPR